ncbi:hypothetical protein D5400_12490 [Georhizobium profundi]|uniref:Uncharacterized protein n=1 Tax=Georhizobium profundi TaxID=2341112 RepID=A0A3Q8XQY2_9HYPH|nr:hypothetical protein [Georhizobium profundi]AZN71984.1 hypothetical protein D5400_12490 [Georhizobium profundi]
MQPSEDAKRLRAIEARMGDGCTLTLVVEKDRSLALEGVEPATRESGRIAVLDRHVGHGLAEFLARAHDDIWFLVGLVRRAADRIKRLEREIGWYRNTLELAGQPSAPPADLHAHRDASQISHGAPEARPDDNRHRNYAAEASMKCDEAAFQQFLSELMEKPCPNAGAAADMLRWALSITSRKHLNSDEAAAARWRELRARFEAWRKQ